MKYFTLAVVVLLASSGNSAQTAAQRPPIYGISHVRFHVTQQEPSVSFYRNILGLIPEDRMCQGASLKCFSVGEQQIVQLDSAQTNSPNNSVEEVAFLTSDVARMRQFLLSRGLHPSPIVMNGNRDSSLALLDPEGHRIIFEQFQKAAIVDHEKRVSGSLIHAGFVVHDRAAADRFYKDILGFHLYWQGGMKEGKDDWVAMQVPDGTDWLEYMLNISPSADHHTFGVANHISLGVPDIRAAEQQLIKNGWKPMEEPKLGRDGKWQLNLYDPDDTRVEFMEFTPAQKPCCSEFTGPHPGPKQ